MVVRHVSLCSNRFPHCSAVGGPACGTDGCEVSFNQLERRNQDHNLPASVALLSIKICYIPAIHRRSHRITYGGTMGFGTHKSGSRDSDILRVRRRLYSPLFIAFVRLRLHSDHLIDGGCRNGLRRQQFGGYLSEQLASLNPVPTW